MEIRKALDSDTPNIVSLLRLSLGEAGMAKSEAFWNWKHKENPFGESPVLVAFVADQLIGVRAFMRWDWRKGDTIIRSVRAVDTAVHPDFHGRGIFSKLTNQLVEECKADGVHFIFNTPNKISMPGYLKMGWQTAGRIPVQFKININHFGNKGKRDLNLSNRWEDLDNLSILRKIESKDSLFSTNISLDYFRWRYRDNPNVKYHILSSFGEDGFILVYRLRKIGFITEVRIVERFTFDPETSNDLNALVTYLNTISIVTLSGTQPAGQSANGFIKLHVGPHLTIRDLNMPDFPRSLTFGNWHPSLGDLELF